MCKMCICLNLLSKLSVGGYLKRIHTQRHYLNCRHFLHPSPPEPTIENNRPRHHRDFMDCHSFSFQHRSFYSTYLVLYYIYLEYVWIHGQSMPPGCCCAHIMHIPCTHSTSILSVWPTLRHRRHRVLVIRSHSASPTDARWHQQPAAAATVRLFGFTGSLSPFARDENRVIGLCACVLLLLDVWKPVPGVLNNNT